VCASTYMRTNWREMWGQKWTNLRDEFLDADLCVYMRTFAGCSWGCMWTKGLKPPREMRISGAFGMRLQREKGRSFRRHDNDHNMVCYGGGVVPSRRGREEFQTADPPSTSLRVRSGGRGTLGSC
jgi:hypothetical protein